ncbi:hypothetical protein VTO42DRAFT_7764 [Malbranchea cinnamomea]
MASVSLTASQRQWPDGQLHEQSAMSKQTCVPNPSFHFPARDPDPDGSSRTTPRSPPPLPAFSFPQAPEPSSPTSPTSPQKPSPLHRRGSGVVGRDDSVSLGTNASNKELPPPSMLPPPGSSMSSQPPGRRTHAHRRSAAISGVDLNAIAKAFPPTPVGGSTSVTPAALRQQQQAVNNDGVTSSSPNTPVSGPRTPTLQATTPADPSKLAPPSSAHSSFKPASTFHRPQSAITSESSTSTVHPSPSHPQPAKQDVKPVRPKTANATFELSSAACTGKPAEGGESLKRPLSASASVTAHVQSSTDIPPVPPLPQGYSEVSPRSTPQENTRSEIPSRAATEKKVSKKKKMRSWAGIWTRKGKKKGSKKSASSRKGPNHPPPLVRTYSDIGSLSGVNFDEDNTIIIRTPTRPNAPQQQTSNTQSGFDSFETSWKPRSFYEQGRESDMLSPVIDLDAALGPFNTPEMRPPQCSGFSLATKRMYSGGRRGQFVGPEMRYHRRAESAPEMPPFDRGAFSHFSVNANPDVFDEEEEDAFLAETNAMAAREAASKQNNNVESAPIKETDRETEQKELHSGSEVGLGIHSVNALESPPSDPDTMHASESRQSTVIVDTPITPDLGQGQDCRHGVEVVDADLVNTSFGNTPDSNPSSGSQLEDKRPVTSPNSCATKPGLAPGQFTTQFRDPEIASVEASRLATASSSTTDRQTFNSLGPANDYIHGSTEDVPSLTSTASTATGTMPRMSTNIYPRNTGDRSGSVSTSVPPRSSGSATSKRSSLVSFTRLVGGSSGEKSKLSYEEKAPPDEPEKVKKRGHRFSRLMHFWKSKEKERSE